MAALPLETGDALKKKRLHMRCGGCSGLADARVWNHTPLCHNAVRLSQPQLGCATFLLLKSAAA